MRSKVILSCVVVILLEFAASIPYSIDLNRYSGYKTRPVLESSLQQNAPKSYQYNNQRYDAGQYRAPPSQYQETLLPKVNRDHYFTRNQQRFLPKRPPQSAQIIHGKYASRQNIPVEKVNQQISEISPVQLQEPVTIIKSSPFIPAIPAEPFRPSYMSASEPLRKVEDIVYLPEVRKSEEIEIPVIRPQLAPIQTVPEIDNFERFFAKASNPVEHIFEPTKPLGSSIDLFLSHPKIRNILSTNKHRKRYLVIHPDGSIEHVDKLESVAEKHPNYMLVNAGDIVRHNEKITIPATKPVINTHPVIPEKEEHILLDKAIVEAQKQEIAPVVKPTVKLESKPIQKKEETEKLSKTVVTEPFNSPPAIITVDAATTEPISSATNIPIQVSEVHTEKQVLPPQDAIKLKNANLESSATEVATSVTEVSAVAAEPGIITTETSLEPDNKITEVSLPQEDLHHLSSPPKSSSAVLVQPEKDTRPINIPEHFNFEQQPEPSVDYPNSAVESGHNKVPDQLEVQSSLEDVPIEKKVEHARQAPDSPSKEIFNEPKGSEEHPRELAEVSSQLDHAPKPSVQPLEHLDLEQTKLPGAKKDHPGSLEEPAHEKPKLSEHNVDHLNHLAQPSQEDISKKKEHEIEHPIYAPKSPHAEVLKEPKDSADHPPQPAEVPDTTQEPTPAKASSVTVSAEKYTPEVPNTVKNVIPRDGSTPTAPKSVNPVELNPIDKYIVEEASNYTPAPEVVIPNFGDFDIAKVPHKPTLWFRTSDPNFWDKLADKDKGLDVVYFFQIHNQPKIEKDVKTTIHPNGTVVEDIVETIWAFEGDEPTITKTTKVIHPEDL